jgi:transcription elongation factor GreA
MSENAEYFAARERQSFVEGRIAELEDIIASANVIDPATASGGHITFGAHVWLLEEDTENEVAFQLVGVHEADIKSGRLSICSPLGRALIGKKVGDSVSVPAPGGERTYHVQNVKFC